METLWFHLIEEPMHGFAEQCFLHKIQATEDSFASINLINPAIGLKTKLLWDTSTLPNMMQWKMQGSGTYALGLEPTNGTIAGREADIKNNKAQFIEPGQETIFKIKLNFPN